jgi:hypothetical protein
LHEDELAPDGHAALAVEMMPVESSQTGGTGGGTTEKKTLASTTGDERAVACVPAVASQYVPSSLSGASFWSSILACASVSSLLPFAAALSGASDACAELNVADDDDALAPQLLRLRRSGPRKSRYTDKTFSTRFPFGKISRRHLQSQAVRISASVSTQLAQPRSGEQQPREWRE